MRYNIDNLIAVGAHWEFVTKHGTRYITGEYGIGVYKVGRIFSSVKPVKGMEKVIVPLTRTSALPKIRKMFGELQKTYSIPHNQLTVWESEPGRRGRKPRARYWTAAQQLQGAR